MLASITRRQQKTKKVCEAFASAKGLAWKGPYPLDWGAPALNLATHLQDLDSR